MNDKGIKFKTHAFARVSCTSMYRRECINGEDCRRRERTVHTLIYTRAFLDYYYYYISRGGCRVRRPTSAVAEGRKKKKESSRTTSSSLHPTENVCSKSCYAHRFASRQRLARYVITTTTTTRGRRKRRLYNAARARARTRFLEA